MIERFNQTLEAQMSKFVSKNQKDWDQYVLQLMMTYRTSVHDTTGCHHDDGMEPPPPY